MECLYKTTTKNTFAEFKKFSNTLFRNKKNIILYTLLSAFLIFDGIVLENIFFIIFAVVYPILIVFLHNRQVKKVFVTNKAFQDLEVNFEFYDTYFLTTDLYGSGQLEYTKLHKIIETKTNFYLMIAKNQGMILVKDNLPAGLADFLRSIKLSLDGVAKKPCKSRAE